MKSVNRTKLALAVLLALMLVLPVASARRKTYVKIYTVPDFDNFVVHDYSVDMPNGFKKVDVCNKFFWFDEDWDLLGYALQYVTGVEKIGSGNDFSTLHGYGVFYNTEDTGTIRYEIGNIWKPNDPMDYFDDEFWAAHLRISSGTGSYEGLKGQGELNFEEFAFELYLDYNPWE